MATRRVKRGILIAAVVGAGIAAAVWFVNREPSGEAIVARSLAALKANDWGAIYDLAIPADKSQMTREQYVSLMGDLSAGHPADWSTTTARREPQMEGTPGDRGYALDMDTQARDRKLYLSLMAQKSPEGWGIIASDLPWAIARASSQDGIHCAERLKTGMIKENLSVLHDYRNQQKTSISLLDEFLKGGPHPFKSTRF